MAEVDSSKETQSMYRGLIQQGLTPSEAEGRIKAYESLKKARVWQQEHRQSMFAEAEAYNLHWKWYLDEYGKDLTRRVERTSIDPVPMGYPILIQQRIANKVIGGTCDGVNTFFRVSAIAGDSDESEWDGTFNATDIKIRDDTVEQTVVFVGRDVESTEIEIQDAPASGSAMDATYSIDYPELQSVQVPDNGKTIYVDTQSRGGGGYSAVIVFAVPQIKTNTQIKGYLRLAADPSPSSTFNKYLYDFTLSDWDSHPWVGNADFTPSTAPGSTFGMYTFYFDDNRYINAKNLCAIRLSGLESGTGDWASFHIDYAWAWLDRKSGWF